MRMEIVMWNEWIFLIHIVCLVEAKIPFELWAKFFHHTFFVLLFLLLGSILSSSSIFALRIWNPDIEEPSPTPHTPTPSKTPTPAPRQSKSPAAEPKSTVPPTPAILDNTCCLDLYIDAVHLLPDSASIIKVRDSWPWQRAKFLLS